MADPADIFDVELDARYHQARGWGSTTPGDRRVAHLPSGGAQIILLDGGSLGGHPLSMCAVALAEGEVLEEVPTCAACRRIAAHYR